MLPKNASFHCPVKLSDSRTPRNEATFENVFEIVLMPTCCVVDPAAGFRHAMYTLVGLVVALMALLIICIILLKKRSKDRERHIQLGY
ncbi:hypothetical protein NQ315_002670 [Exocentrus adspersus]|uniref:MHC class II antigen n=1 Tax=Exocentrus adspersus TaxID=1586481 RepID=A0AAV8VUW9_9CUCU|nr:hypothetical protein NQ315_002670 [Exocentrus adspersus]